DARLPMLRSSGLPCVLIGYPDDPGQLSCVDLDMHQAAVRAVDHLADLGHGAIAMFGSLQAVYYRESTYAMRFASGFEEGARRREVVASWRAVDQSHEAAAAAVDELLATRPEVTGIVVHNEAILPTVLSVLESRGRSVPGDISIIALCPTDMAENQRVPLTNIAVPAAEIGRVAVEMLLRRLDGAGGAEIRLLAPELT